MGQTLMVLILSFLGLFATALASNGTSANLVDREGKLFSMFQVIKFPNTDCVGTNSRNGTCFTTSECTNKKGTSSGSCASGYGVCCTFVLGCGGTSSQNNTYFEVSGGSAGLCTASVCKVNSNICQIRLDFNTFVISGPSTLTVSTLKTTFGQVAGGGAATVNQASQCLTDTFTATGNPTSSVPVVCGTLTGEHIYLEAGQSCTNLNFNLGATAIGTAVASRNWQVKVTQYACDYINRAPVGCLQYFFGSNTGIVKSFNFGGSPAYHLANQQQSICIRRERSNCRICWAAIIATDIQLSLKTASAKGKTAKSGICCGYKSKGTATNGGDCIIIPGASSLNNAAIQLSPTFCGRSVGLVKTNDGAIAVITTICSKRTPFKISFYSDNWEMAGTGSESIKSAGFRLGFAMTSC